MQVKNWWTRLNCSQRLLIYYEIINNLSNKMKWKCKMYVACIILYLGILWHVFSITFFSLSCNTVRRSWVKCGYNNYTHVFLLHVSAPIGHPQAFKLYILKEPAVPYGNYKNPKKVKTSKYIRKVSYIQNEQRRGAYEWCARRRA
jgi:hypothetical protein